MSHSFKQTVLLIEADTALRRLISLGLQGHDITVVEALSPAHLPYAVESSPPDLLVLDVDSGIRSDWSLLAEIQAQPELADLPAVVLAWDGLSPDSETRRHLQILASDKVTYMAKPFDARRLHTTIEELLESSAVSQSVAVPLTFAPVTSLASATVPAPSLCPFITALGLMFAVAGSLVNIAFFLLGIGVVIAALLWWTLGKKPVMIEAHEPLLMPVAAGQS